MAPRHANEPALLGESFNDLAAMLREPRAEARRPILREPGEERAVIEPPLRKLIHQRDRWRCAWCCWSPFPERWDSKDRVLQLDHIIPWSAGGSDRSSNLRTLCDVCNAKRSNYRADMDIVNVLPVAFWCDPCADRSLEVEIDDPEYRPADAIPVFCGHGNHNSWTIWRIRIS